METRFGERWKDVLRFNRVDRRHVYPGVSLKVPRRLEDVADFYDQEVENRLAVITTMIEPVLMLTMGLIMAVIVVALYLPIFEMGARLK